MLPDLTQIRKITVPDLLSDPLGSYVLHGDLSGDATAEAERVKLMVGSIATQEADAGMARALKNITVADVSRILKGIAADVSTAPPDALEDFLRMAIELCPISLTARLRVKIATGDLLASPRRHEHIPALTASMPFQAPANRRKSSLDTRAAL